MASTKRFSLGFEAGLTVYLTAKRKADSYLLDDADGVFRAAPADFAVAMSADGAQPALYVKEEARTSWQDGDYLIAFYLQVGGSPAPTTDPLIASNELTLEDDAEVVAGGNSTSSVTNITTTTTGGGSGSASTATLEKLVRALLHDNKMVLDAVENLKGSHGSASSSPKKGSYGPRQL